MGVGRRSLSPAMGEAAVGSCRAARETVESRERRSSWGFALLPLVLADRRLAIVRVSWSLPVSFRLNSRIKPTLTVAS
ncbi:hypothetical protein Dimus_036333 [Dionaea muscipula]